MKLLGVPIADIPAVWPSVSNIVDKAIQRHGDARWTIDHVYTWLTAGEMQLWVDDTYKSVCITQILVYPTGTKELLIWLAATESGHLDGELELLDKIIASASVVGCSRAIAYCRRGLTKRLKDWKIRSVELVKEIKDARETH